MNEFDFDNRLNRLAEKGWLSKVPQDFRTAVLSRCAIRTFTPGSMIYDVGDKADGLLGLIDGQVQVLLGRGRTIHATAHVARPADWFGGYTVLAGEGRMMALQAKTKAEIAHLSLSSIYEIVAHKPENWRWIGLLPGINVSATLMAVEDLMIRDPNQRCVAVLLRLAECRNPGSSPGIAKVNQSELAIMSNTSRSTAAALLAKLDDQGFVQRAYREIRVLHPDRVRELLAD